MGIAPTGKPIRRNRHPHLSRRRRQASGGVGKLGYAGINAAAWRASSAGAGQKVIFQQRIVSGVHAKLHPLRAFWSQIENGIDPRVASLTDGMAL
jgi:hypothetical protein